MNDEKTSRGAARANYPVIVEASGGGGGGGSRTPHLLVKVTIKKLYKPYMLVHDGPVCIFLATSK